MPTPPTLDAAVCERLISSAAAAATKTCPPPAIPATAAPSTADGLAAVADAIALATFGLAIIVAFATLGWFVYVRHRTREEARTEVEKVAPAHIKAYLDERLTGMVSEAVAVLTVTAGTAPSSPMTAQEQREAFSEVDR